MGVWMVGQSNVAPVIIKRKKIIQASAHHGGAWKVAYADFVTAMMAFFMLMWLLNATTEKQRKGIADYFSPTIPMSRISGGGDGAFGGDSIFSEQTLAKNGTGASSERASAEDKAKGDSGQAEQKAIAEVQQALTAHGGESMTMERMLRHVVTKVTDQGLVIEIFDTAEESLFSEGTADPSGITRKLAQLLSQVLALASNQIAVEGHLRSYPITLKDNPTWDLSAQRAQIARQLIEEAGLSTARMSRITGHADRKPLTADPSAIRNNRIEIILLRKDR